MRLGLASNLSHIQYSLLSAALFQFPHFPLLIESYMILVQRLIQRFLMRITLGGARCTACGRRADYDEKIERDINNLGKAHDCAGGGTAVS